MIYGNLESKTITSEDDGIWSEILAERFNTGWENTYHMAQFTNWVQSFQESPTLFVHNNDK